MGEFLSEWTWGSAVLNRLHGALLTARDAMHGADSLGTIRDRLPDWPWQYVCASELSDTLQATNKPGKRQRHSAAAISHPPRTPKRQLYLAFSNLPRTPRPKKRQRLMGSENPLPQNGDIEGRALQKPALFQPRSSNCLPISTPSLVIHSPCSGTNTQNLVVNASPLGRGQRRKTPKRFFDEQYRDPTPSQRRVRPRQRH